MSANKEKQRVSAWLYPETIYRIKDLYRMDDCRNRSEFIEKAIRFYIGYLTAEDKTNYLPNIFLSNMKSIVSESDNRTSRMMFKIAVELAMLQNIIANLNDIDKQSLTRLRGGCVDEVKSLGGNITFENALDCQKG